jgi:hypothetical protein
MLLFFYYFIFSRNYNLVSKSSQIEDKLLHLVTQMAALIQVKRWLVLNFLLLFIAYCFEQPNFPRMVRPGNTKGGSITVLLTSCLTGLESAVWQMTIFVFICKTD